jgi:spore coat polysaccharide biosynthesis protein SpsF
MKIGAVIPIRLCSERLPGKQLKDICGRPALYHLLDRVTACRHISSKRHVVVCTTTEAGDNPLVPVVEAYGCSVYRGAVDDLICRLAEAMKAHSFDIAIQADGDNPLVATEYMNRTVDGLRAEPSLDIVSTVGLPLGTNTKSFTRAAMDKVIAAYRSPKNDTGYMHFFTKAGLCKQAEIGPVGPEHVHDTARLTIDYDADLEMIRKIFAALYRPAAVFGLTELVAFLNTHPNVVAINSHVSAEYWKRFAQKLHLEYVAADGAIATITH